MLKAISTLVLALATTVVAQSPQPQTATVPAPAATAAPVGWPTAQFASAKDPSVQKSYQILNDMIRALGGDAYLNIRDMTSEGRTYGFSHGSPNSMSILYWRFWQWPDKERVEITKQRDIIEIYNGDKAYETTYKGTTTQDPKELTDYLRRRDHSLEWVIRQWLPASGAMILYSGTAMVERNLADQVTVLNARNDSVTLSVDPTSHLPVKVSYSWRDPVDRQMDDEAVIFANYRLIQGIQTPFSTVRERNGEMTNQRFLSSASYNTGLAATMFEAGGITYNPVRSAPPK